MTCPPVPADDAPGAGASGDAQGPEQDEFAPLLRAVIEARGVSLEQLRLALAARGSKVSVATLSYWRTGRSRPDRGDSIVALARLEEVLAVPAGFLLSRITPRGPGRAAAEALPSHYSGRMEAGALDASMAPQLATEALDRLGLSWETGLRRVSIHERLTLRDDGRAGPMDVRVVCVAEEDGVDRYPIWYAHDDPTGIPYVLPVAGCRLSRVREFTDPRSVAVDMTLDRPLARGEVCILDYRLEALGPTQPLESQLRAVIGPLRELVVEVRFPEGRRPAQAVRRTVRDGETVREPVAVTSSLLSMLCLDPEEGINGLEWTW